MDNIRILRLRALAGIFIWAKILKCIKVNKTAVCVSTKMPGEEEMKINEAGIELIKRFEGCRLQTYRDSVGIPTIGYGSTGSDIHMGMTITQEEAEERLQKKLSIFCPGVASRLKVPVSSNQFSALVCFAYNVGLTALEKSKLLRKLNAGDVLGASEEFERWDKAGGRVLAGLLKRRLAEKALFLA